MLKYDTRRKPCARCYVNSYRVGFASIRRAGESWEQLERRVARTPRSAFPESARHESTSLSTLDPAIQGDVERMLADAARAGFDVRVVATFRSPLAEAYVMRMHRGTHTLTSMHSYGRALDVVIGDGDLHRARTRAQWVAFRRWVASDNGGEFRILGKPDTTWDWGHIEVPSPNLGFHDIDAALTRARVCSAPSATLPCNFPLPGAPRVAMRR